MFTLTAPRLARLAVIVPCAALLVAACEHNLGPIPGPLATITVTPNPTLPIGALQPFVATGRDAHGNLVAITPTWSIVAGGGASNSSSGLFTAGTAAGTFTLTVRATSGSISGFATVIVTSPGTLASINVTQPGGHTSRRHHSILCRGPGRERHRGSDLAGGDVVGGIGRRHHQQQRGLVHRGRDARNVQQYGAGTEWRHFGLRHGHRDQHRAALATTGVGSDLRDPSRLDGDVCRRPRRRQRRCGCLAWHHDHGLSAVHDQRSDTLR